MDTSVGQSDWDDTSGMAATQEPKTRTNRDDYDNMEAMETADDSIALERIDEGRTGKENRGKEGKGTMERGEPQVRAPSPTIMPPPSQVPRKGRKRKEEKGKDDGIEDRLERLMKELISLREDIRGREKEQPGLPGKGEGKKGGKMQGEKIHIITLCHGT